MLNAVSNKAQAWPRQGVMCQKTHMRLGDERILVPLEVPAAAVRRLFRFDRQVVRDQYEPARQRQDGEACCAGIPIARQTARSPF